MGRFSCDNEYEERERGRRAAGFGPNYGSDHLDRMRNRYDDECDRAYAEGYQREIDRREEEHREEEHRERLAAEHHAEERRREEEYLQRQYEESKCAREQEEGA